ncbi:hypothetical protein Tco_1391902 [Tanacetum coccineum]
MGYDKQWKIGFGFVMESNGTESDKSDVNDTDADDADIRPIYDKEPMAESYDNQTTEYSKQSLESENILLKKTVAQFQKDFSRMEAHCIALELKYQNLTLKSRHHGQILNETSNKAKIKKEIDVLETMNIELEHSVAKLHKENETLKNHYKDLYDSIKITRSKTIEQKTSLLANNVDVKAQIQEKVFAIAALKNDLRKLKGNITQHYLPKRRESVSTKPNHMIASSESRDSSKNMPRFSSNDMVHNHYLDEARKKTQERDRNSKTNVIPSARFQSIADGSKQKSRSTNHSTRSLPDDSEPTHGSNLDILNIHESKQSLDLSAGTSINVQKEQSIDLSAVVSKSFAVTNADASDKRQQQPDSTSSTSTLATTVTADGNFDL